MVKKVSSYVFLLLLGWLVATLLMVAVAALPSSPVRHQLQESIEIQEAERSNPALLWGGIGHMDRFTDSLMLQNALYTGNESIWFKAMMVPHNNFNLQNMKNTGALKSPLEAVIDDIYGKPADSVTLYPRYWHGYLVVIKPLLSIVNYGKLRMINMFIQYFLVFFTLYYMIKRRLTLYIPAFFISYLFLIPAVLPLNFQFTSCTIIMLVALIILLKKNISLSDKILPYYFVCIGMATAFFDFLTFPIITAGIPIIMLVNKCDVLISWKDKGIVIIKNLIAWLYGYVGLWGGKWIIASVSTDNNVIVDALQQVLYRTSATVNEGGSNLTFSHLGVIGGQFGALRGIPIIFLVLVLLIAIYKLYSIKFVHHKPLSITIDTAIVYFICMCIPFVWYLAVGNHSFVHRVFTSRGLIVFIFGLFSLISRVYLDSLGLRCFPLWLSDEENKNVK